MPDFVKIENMNGMARDISSHAVISTSTEMFQDYQRRKALAMERDAILQQQQEQINALKDSLEEIKQMLQAFIKR